MIIHRAFTGLFTISLLAAALGCTARYTAPFADADGVAFRFHAPAAHEVAIAGSFNRWDPARDRLSGPDKAGWWSITLRLSEGRHEYLFVVDNRDWVLDPLAVAYADDGFGSRNSVFYLER
ncbi:MAG: glycogen-binding domain-containing protein [Nitrospirota bacterium]